MIEYKNNSSNNIVEISVEGKITEADFDRVSSQMKADINKHGKLRLLETFHSFEGIDPITLWKDRRVRLRSCTRSDENRYPEAWQNQSFGRCSQL